MKIPIRFYYTLCASTVLPLRCYDSCRFDQNLVSKRNRRQVGGGGGVILYLNILVIFSENESNFGDVESSAKNATSCLPTYGWTL